VKHDATVDQLVRAVAPGTELDEGVLQSLLDDRPRAADVVPLVSSDIPAVVRAAVLYLGLYGTLRECPVLALCLRHSDDRVVELAERGLWSIWMQSGGREGNVRLASAVSALASDNYEAAIRTLSLLVVTEPKFAEAHFQLGLALSSADRPEDAARSYHEALRLNPYHFAAAAALGHTCVEQGNLPAALHFYEQSLRIHPRLTDVPEAIRQVRALLPNRGR
jgi:tetratricopeptide (TPR) repeat protein